MTPLARAMNGPFLANFARNGPFMAFGVAAGSQKVGSLARLVDAWRSVCHDASVTSCTIIIAERAG